MKVDVISDYASFMKLAKEWNELAERFTLPFLRHEWTDLCLTTLYPNRTQPNIILVRSGGKARAIAPLIAVYQSGVRHLVMPGGNILHEPCGLLYNSEAALEELAHSLRKTQASLMLPRFNVNAPETLMLQALPIRGWCSNRSGGSSLHVPFKGTWEQFEASMSHRRRSHLRGYRRKAEKLGKVEFDVVHPDVDALTPLLEEFFRIEASGWKGRAGTAALLHPRVHRFYCDYARSTARQGMLRFFFLKIDGKTAAARMALEYGKRLWDLKIAYDEAYRECVPGILLTHETLRYSLERGLEAQEFLGQAEAWERHWPCEEDEYVSMRVYPFSLTGQLSLTQDAFQLALREVPKVAQDYMDRVRAKALSGISALLSFLPVTRSGTGGHNPSI